MTQLVCALKFLVHFQTIFLPFCAIWHNSDISLILPKIFLGGDKKIGKHLVKINGAGDSDNKAHSASWS